MVTRRRLVVTLGASALAAPFGVFSQKPGKVPQIGYLEAATPSGAASRIGAFRKGLADLGYVEGKTIDIQYRYADDQLDRLPALAAELVRLKVDIMIAGGPSVIRSAKASTTSIPIVMGFDTDPVGSGFIASLARPGGNITGLATLAPQISAKQVELLHTIIPKLARVAVLGTSTRPGSLHAFEEVKRAADVFKIQVQYQDALDAKSVDAAFQAASKWKAGAVICLGGPAYSSQLKEIIQLTAKSRLPVMFDRGDFVEAGGLITYGVSLSDLLRRAATYVDKILKGRAPADLPIELPTKFDLVINMKTAKALGLKISESIVVQATRMIE